MPNTNVNWILKITTVTVIATFALSLSPFTIGSPVEIYKRSFFDIDCRGSYDKESFAQLDRICNDCYKLYREPQLHFLCRSNCFGSPYFKGCLEALLYTEDELKYEEMIEILGKK